MNHALSVVFVLRKLQTWGATKNPLLTNHVNKSCTAPEPALPLMEPAAAADMTEGSHPSSPSPSAQPFNQSIDRLFLIPESGIDFGRLHFLSLCVLRRRPSFPPFLSLFCPRRRRRLTAWSILGDSSKSGIVIRDYFSAIIIFELQLELLSFSLLDMTLPQILWKSLE